MRRVCRASARVRRRPRATPVVLSVVTHGRPWRTLARQKNDQLVVSVPLPDGLGALEVGELRAGHEWKIDGFPLLADDTP